MPNVGYATLQIIPSVRGIGDELRRQLVGPAADAGSNAGEESGGGFKDAFKGALAAIGITEVASKIGEQFTEAFTAALEQANVTSTLQAQLGASGKDASKYGAAVGRLYARGVTENFEQGAEVIRSVVNAGLVSPDATNKQLDSIATKMTDVANTFGTDMSMQTQAVSALLKNGLAPSASSALDTITVGLQKLGPNAEDLLETFQEYPVQLKKLGLDATTAMGLFQQGLKGGARDTDIVADALKEFSIRSIDMSAGSRAAYKSLKLDAKSMEEQIGKGGASATAGLQTVLDKLRGIHDPVKREAAAVGLFGTQAEELGTSLFKLDPSKATKTFSNVGGAASKLGKTIRSGPSYEITLFQRTMKQSLVNFIGGQVLPVLSRWGGIFNKSVLPPLSAVGGVLAAVFVPTLQIVGTVLSGTINWFREWGVWLIPLAILIGGVTLALNAQAIATGIVTAVFSIYRAAILVGTAVTEGFAAAQALLNSVMALNPFVLVAIAVVALGAALVIAWKKSQTFRDIVMGAWQGIQTAAMWAWNNVLKPVFAALVVGWKAIADGALWLWRTVLQPVFSFLSTAARIVATIYVTVLLVAFKVWWTGVKFYFTAVAAIAVWLWKNVLSPVIGWIVAGFQLWWTGVKLYFSLVMAGFKAVGAAAVWLWTNAISPVVNWIIAGFLFLWAGVKVIYGWLVAGLKTVGGWAKWLWAKAISPVVAAIVAGFGLMWTGVQVIYGWFIGGIKTVGKWATWLWKNAISPAMNGVKSVISTVYNTGIKPVIDAFKSLIHGLGSAFSTAVSAIKKAWDKVKSVAKAPVSFIVNTVYNNGIRGVWNKVAKAFGAPSLPAFKFATGGVMPGYTPGRDVHLAALSGGEAIMRPEWTRAVGPGYVHAMNAAARGGGVRGVQRALGLPGYKDGGIFGWIGKAGSALKGVGSDAWNAIKKGASWLKDTLAASARAGVKNVVEPLLKQLPGAGTAFGKMISKVPEKAIDTLVGYAEKADDKGASSSFGGGKIPTGQHAAIIKAALSAAGVPPPGTMAQWMSGMNTLITRESGWNASAVNNWDSNAKAGHPSQGLAQTIPGTWSAYVPSSLRSRGILDPVGNVAAAIRYIVARYGNITNVQQANASKPPAGYAGGGRPRPGEVFWVGERGPELMQLGGHGATVWDSATSARMAAGLGSLRGFASGTSGAKARAAARKQVPGDLTSVSKVLTASAADIKKAFAELTKDLKATGGAAKALATSSSKASTKLQSLAKQRDSVASKLATAKQAATDQKSTASDFLGLSNLSGAASISDVITGLKGRQSTVKGFQSQISKLSKKGLSQSLIQQLVAMGPDSTLAGMLSGASSGQIKQLNALAKSGTSLSTSYGKTMADAMYDAGTNASKGFLTGLQSQEKELQAAMNKLGAGLVSSIKKKLQIKSPSRVTRWVGRMTGTGVGLGLDDTAAQVAAAAARVSDAAVPDTPTVSPAGISAAAPTAQGAGLAAGTPLRLVLRDGTEFEAYIDNRADARVNAGFTRVRRAVKASK